MKNLLLFFISITFGVATLAQQEDVPFDKRLFEDDKEGFDNAIKEIKKGDFHFFDGTETDLNIALGHYLTAQEFNPYSSVLNYKIGICYLYSNKKFKSLEYLKFAHDVNPEVDPNIHFYLAQAYHLKMEFDKAIEHYNIQKDIIGSKDEFQRIYINKKIRECRTGKEMVDNPVRVWIENLGDSVNTEFSEYSPVISADNRVLFYTGRRPDSQGGEKDKSGIYLEDIYSSTRGFGEDWGNSINLGTPVNSKSHDATVGLAPDGKSLLIYKSISGKNGDIFITRQGDDGVWEEPSSIGDNINTKFHESSATLTFDEKVLFFDSDKPGGEGQHDIYVSYWDEEKGEWGEPENIGPTINTQYEEKGVFVSDDGKTLYFSSDGHDNMGGLDIFKTTFDEETGKWSEPENLGYPINTPDDDVYFVVTGDERYAYYSSYREDGLGEKDIYRITFLGDAKQPLIADADLVGSDFDTELNQPLTDLFTTPNTGTGTSDEVAEKLVTIKGKVMDGSSNKPLGNAQIDIVDSKTNKVIQTLTSNSDGTYSINLEAGKDYGFTVSKKDYTIDSKTVSTSKKDGGSTKTVDFSIVTPAPDVEFTLNNIYFDFDKSDLRNKSVLELDKLVQIMKDHPTMIIELSGHTDRRGSDEYNMALSKRRAEIAKEYLVSKGISASRIKTKGYGETRPAIDGATISAMKTRKEKEAAHQANRRTVIKIISQ